MKDGRRFGRPPKPYTPPEVPDGKINVTDLDSRNVKTLRGWVQGYNAQAACTEDRRLSALGRRRASDPGAEPNAATSRS